MGWITLSQALSGAGVGAGVSSYEAAQLVATWLQNQGAQAQISTTHPVITLYSRDGISLKQRQSVRVVEYRGLAQDLANGLALYLPEDNTRQWSMYGIDQAGNIHEAEITYGPAGAYATDSLLYKIGGTGAIKAVSGIHTMLGYYFYPPTDGKKIEVDTHRSNAADGWAARVVTTDFYAPSYSADGANFREINKAFIPVPPREAWEGVIVSKDARKTFIADDFGTPVFQNITTVEKEYRYLSLAQAAEKVSSEAASNSRTIDVRVHVTWGQNTYKNITVRGGGATGVDAATDKVATCRPQGHGLFTVTVNETTYQVTTS